MSSTTDYLKLLLPGNGEYENSWDEVLNADLIAIDTAIKNVTTEVEEARLGKSSLSELLSISINTDGSLIATPEVVAARNSFLYGDEDALSQDLDLGSRLNLLDNDLFFFRSGLTGFREMLSKMNGAPKSILSGVKDSNGYPTWLASTGVNVNVDGSVENIYMSIYGKMGRIRKQEQITISGAVGEKYLYASYNPGGVIRVDGSASANGVVSSDGAKVRWFDVSTSDFTLLDVKPGDILEILGTGVNAGVYQIKQVAPGAVTTRLLIYGVFKGGVAQASLNYTIKDPFAMTLGFDVAKTEVDGKLYFGVASFDGIAVTSVKAMNFADCFISEWRAVDVSATTTFTEVFNHNLFDDALEVFIEVSQANDGSDYVEELSKSQINNSLAITNSLALSSGTQTLSGSVTLTGELVEARSANVRWNKYTVEVANVTPGLFYKNFSGATLTVGYVRVIARRMRK